MKDIEEPSEYGVRQARDSAGGVPDMRSPPNPNGDNTRITQPPTTGAVTHVEYSCKVCGQVFDNQKDLVEHEKSHEEVQERVEKQGPAGVG